MTAEDLHALLRLRFPLPEFALFRQVCEAGTGGARYMDALAMNLFRSRGMEVHGFEIKVTRSDWLRELKDPAKADPLARFCDRYWIVAPEGAKRPLIPTSELPPTWGLLVPRAGTLYAQVPAPKREAEPLSRGFVATILRRAVDDGSMDFDGRIRDAVREERGRLAKVHAKELEERTAPLRRLEAALGMSIEAWDRTPEDVASAVKLVLKGQDETAAIRRRMEWAREALTKAVAMIDELLPGEEAPETEQLRRAAR